MDVKKILFIIGSILIMYFVVFQKKTTYEKSNLENETLKSNPVSNRNPIPNSSTAVQLPQQPAKRLAAPAQPLRPSSSSAFSVTAVKPTNPPEELVNPKYEQIIPEYGDYAATPKVLTGNSAKVFSLTFPRYLMPDIELKDIQSAFMNGIYPPKEIIEILGLADIFEGTIYVDYQIKFQVIWNLVLSTNQNPVQGVFSLQMNGVETSCKPSTLSPLKSMKILSKDDNGTILVQSCDKSFYMQLYRNSANTITGSYFEQNKTNGKFTPVGSVSLYRNSHDNL